MPGIRESSIQAMLSMDRHAEVLLPSRQCTSRKQLFACLFLTSLFCRIVSHLWSWPSPLVHKSRTATLTSTLISSHTHLHGIDFQCRDPGSNRGPSDLQSDALPTELSRPLKLVYIKSLKASTEIPISHATTMLIEEHQRPCKCTVSAIAVYRLCRIGCTCCCGPAVHRLCTGCPPPVHVLCMYVCMYVCIVCMHVCMYVCIYVCMYVCM